MPISFPNNAKTMRPCFMARQGVVSSGHGLASLAGSEILRKGGNAFDAGVAAAMCLSILMPDYAGFVGVAPFIGYSAKYDAVYAYSGVGVAPAKANIEFFASQGLKKIPRFSIYSQLIPASVDTWIAILQRLGTMSFTEISAAARQLAWDGFPAHGQMIKIISQNEENIRKYPYNSSIFFQTGGIPSLGELFAQKDAAKSIDIMIEAEKKARQAGKSREQALEAVRDEFYQGEIAEAIAKLHQDKGGLITYEDLASFHGKWEEPLVAKYKEYAFYTTSTWTQGPLLIQFLNLLEGFDLNPLGHNSADYVHLISSVIDLGMADRERFYGDPDFVEVPYGLWTKEYAAARRDLLSPGKAFQELPPHGDPVQMLAVAEDQRIPLVLVEDKKPSLADTTYVCAADAQGNIFSLTPSDGGFGSPMVPDYGIILGGRMTQFRLDPGHAACLAPGKRPTITPAPALVLKNGKPFMALGTPGADQQTQTMLQVFLNVAEFGMNVQQAVESPRFGSYNFPGWFSPHPYYPGRLCIESRLGKRVGPYLKKLGREIINWEDWTMLAGAVCVVMFDRQTGTIHAGADPRRESYAIGW
ncbi:MAG: gamma-glutamyltransferase family protein [Deltaproteobacteria bacterium]|nr:gamma-glutamyltransferase family protein [Deltaproteobacteria bacterium]